MKQIFAVLDTAAETFGTPFFLGTNAEALRSFATEVNTGQPGQSAVATHPNDYHLYVIGEYDEQKGVITPKEPERLVRAVDLIKPKGAI
ncbi:MAG: nonstructural protein [Microviridae sp.]|nr:MAG: nonstructural protein [Microviridae sp.]